MPRSRTPETSTAADTDLVLRSGGRSVGRYVTRPRQDRRLSPRPYLHPVTTRAGTLVTELGPADHPHHLGVGVAVPDVEGHNFWGGRTFVPGRGPTELDNHGVQLHEEFAAHGEGGFEERLSWVADGRELLRERRTAAVVGLGADAWALDFGFALTNATDLPLSIGSPATNGRPGAAYGGFFWRAPAEGKAPRVFTAAAEGEGAVHGSCAPWLALASASWTLVFAGATTRTREDPWFVRAADYPGVGSSLAHRARLRVAAGGTVERRLVTVVADGRLGTDEAAALISRALGGVVDA
ncbi:PmoA family protein [Streptomyces smyrnaeus]|uniref:DUF6807 domain-containing protein n=1 Tax=Streptomyces smyrnaeus TaxID=1387713 RepID=UPI0036800152